MRAIKYFKDPEALQLVGDPTRRRIIYLLRAKEMTVSMLASELDKTPQAIYHHTRKLLEKGLIEVAREERIDHFIETYYRAAAEVFEFTHGGQPGGFYEAHLRETADALRKLGVNINIDDETLVKIIRLQDRIHSIAATAELETRVNQLEDIDFLTKEELYKFVQLLTISDKQFEEYLALQRDLRNLLKSRLMSKEITSKQPSPSRIKNENG